jgi:hypothetical protein
MAIAGLFLGVLKHKMACSGKTLPILMSESMTDSLKHLANLSQIYIKPLFLA